MMNLFDASNTQSILVSEQLDQQAIMTEVDNITEVEILESEKT